MATTPITRFIEKVDDNAYKVYNKSSPHYYKDSSGNLHSIDQHHSQSKSNSNIGNFQLYEKNINSVGIRSGSNNTTKYIGIRPDETQEDGSQQMEWSIENININGNEITPDLSKYEKNDTVVNLGNVAVQSTRRFTRQVVHYTDSISDFKVTYKLNLNGLQISNDKYTETTTIRNSISESLIDCGDISGSHYTSMTELQTHSESILSVYFTDDAFLKNVNFNPNPYYNYNNSGLSMMSGSEFVGNTGSFYFIQRDSNFWGYDTDWDYMSSAYFKDNMLLKFKDINLAHKIKDYILDLTNTKIDDNYIRIKGGKKVGAFVYPPDNNMALLTLSLKDITHISSSYRYKNFDDWSHVAMSYSDILNGIQTQLSSSNAITASTNYYEPSNNEFNIVDNDNNIKYRISLPILLDSNFKQVTNDTLHTLKDNGDGSYEYIKYPSKNLFLGGITSSVNYIDAMTMYGETADGFVRSSLGANYGAWGSIQGGTTGASVDASSDTIIAGFYTLISGGGKFSTIRPRLDRGFLYFDTSPLNGTVLSNGSYLHVTKGSGTSNNLDTYIVKGTQASSLTTDSYNDFEGWTSTFDGDTGALTDYSDNPVDFQNLNANTKLSWSLNSTAATEITNDITGSGNTRIAVLIQGDYTDVFNDNNGNDPGGYGSRFYSTDETGTNRDPYLYLEMDEDYISKTFTIISGNTTLKSGKLTIK